MKKQMLKELNDRLDYKNKAIKTWVFLTVFNTFAASINLCGTMYNDGCKKILNIVLCSVSGILALGCAIKAYRDNKEKSDIVKQIQKKQR